VCKPEVPQPSPTALRESHRISYGSHSRHANWEIQAIAALEAYNATQEEQLNDAAKVQ